MGKIEARDAEAHPAANVVLKAVGIDENLCMDFTSHELQDEDIFIICSDGLYKDLEEPKIANLIQENKADLLLVTQVLLTASLEAGGTDNTSIIALKAIQRKDNV